MSPLYLPYISHVSPLRTCATRRSRCVIPHIYLPIHLAHISPISALHPPHISPNISPISPHISPISPLHLPFISPMYLPHISSKVLKQIRPIAAEACEVGRYRADIGEI